MITNRANSGFKGPAASSAAQATSLELVERVLPDFVLAVLRAHGVRRLAAGMECRTFGAHTLEQLAFVTGSMQQALEYRSAVVVLKDGKVVAQGFQRFQRTVAPVRALSAVPAAQPARVVASANGNAGTQISAPALPRALPPVGVNTLRLRAK